MGKGGIHSSHLVRVAAGLLVGTCGFLVTPNCLHTLNRFWWTGNDTRLNNAKQLER